MSEKKVHHEFGLHTVESPSVTHKDFVKYISNKTGVSREICTPLAIEYERLARRENPSVDESLIPGIGKNIMEGGGDEKGPSIAKATEALKLSRDLTNHMAETMNCKVEKNLQVMSRLYRIKAKESNPNISPEKIIELAKKTFNNETKKQREEMYNSAKEINRKRKEMREKRKEDKILKKRKKELKMSKSKKD